MKFGIKVRETWDHFGDLIISCVFGHPADLPARDHLKPCEGWELALDARIYHRFFGHFYREVLQNLRKAILIHQSLSDYTQQLQSAQIEINTKGTK